MQELGLARGTSAAVHGDILQPIPGDKAGLEKLDFVQTSVFHHKTAGDSQIDGNTELDCRQRGEMEYLLSTPCWVKDEDAALEEYASWVYCALATQTRTWRV